MPTPLLLEVAVDSTEYSRYERDLKTITATITASGGSPYLDVPIYVDLVKARLSRDAVVGRNTLTLTNPADVIDLMSTFDLNSLVDQDMISLVRHGKYFVRATYEATTATASIGSGPDGTIVLSAPEGLVGNSYTVEVVVPGGTSALSVAIVDTAITINLATSLGVPVDSANTAVIVTAALQGAGITASVSGNGSGIFNSAIAVTSFSGGSDQVIGESEDFDIRIMSIARFKKDYLFGIDLKATKVLGIKFPPQAITGISISEVSATHPKGIATLSYTNNTTYDNATVDIGAGVDGTVTITAEADLQGSTGNWYVVEVVVPAGTEALSASLDSNVLTVSLDTLAGVPTAANTATAIAAAIDALDSFSAVASGTGLTTIVTASGPTSFSGGSTSISRLLNWAGGAAVNITGPGTYILPKGQTGPGSKLLGGSAAKDYIIVRVRSTALLPETSISEELLVDFDTMSEETLGRYLEEAIAYLEHDLLNVYLEPTNVVTDRDATTLQYSSGINSGVPIHTDTDYDFIVNPLTYFVPVVQGRWVQIQTPFPQLLRVDSLFGAIANTRVITIDLSWVEHSQAGGFIQLVPFNQETSFDFLGLIWVNAIRGATELPNFWHFNFIVGLRDTPAELQEYIGKYAGVNALTAASLAFRPGIGSLSLSRDGVSESTSYNTQAQYGAYTGAIQSYKDWMDLIDKKVRAKYRGARMVVV